VKDLVLLGKYIVIDLEGVEGDDAQKPVY